MWQIMLCSLLLAISSVNGQGTLEEMINKLRLEQSYDKPESQANFAPPPQQQGPQYPNLNQLLSTAPNLDNRYDPRISNEVAKSVLQLAHDIGTNIANTDRSTKSQIFSPVSIAGALSLVLLGSNGRTYDELSRLFGFDRDPVLKSNPYKIHEEFSLMLEDLVNDMPNPNRPRLLSPWKYMRKPDHNRVSNNENTNVRDYHKISVANGIFVQTGFSLRPDYRTTVENAYRSEILSLEFQKNSGGSRNYINEWVNQRTNGKIREIISGDIQPDTKMIIASALYFKALWEKTFIEGATNTKNFFPDGLNGSSVPVEMMAHGGIFPFYDAKEYGCRILGFPYKGNLTTMYVILPNDSNRQRVQEIQAALTADKIEDMISKMTLKTAIILFPKLHIQNTVNLKRTLNQLGVNTLFSSQQSDLSLISSGQAQNFSPNVKFAGIRTHEQVAQMVSSYEESRRIAAQPDQPFYFSRYNDSSNMQSRSKRGVVTYKVQSNRRSSENLRIKDFIIDKRITKFYPGKKLLRNKRQSVDPSMSLKNLDMLRSSPQSLSNPGLFAEEILHKIDLTVNEKGTEGGAASVVYLTRTGTDVVFRVETPFLILIRHDATKLPLFYGTVYEPTNF